MVCSPCQQFPVNARLVGLRDLLVTLRAGLRQLVAVDVGFLLGDFGNVVLAVTVGAHRGWQIGERLIELTVDTGGVGLDPLAALHLPRFVFAVDVARDTSGGDVLSGDLGFRCGWRQNPMRAVAVLAQGCARVVFAQLGHAVHAVAIQQGNTLILCLDQVALMADRAIHWIERLVRRAAFRNLGRGIDLVAGRAPDRLVRRSLEQVRGCGLQLLAVSLGLIRRRSRRRDPGHGLVNSGRKPPVPGRSARWLWICGSHHGRLPAQSGASTAY